MPHKAADRIRNVALIGHRGCGKTSLHEAMLFEAGAVNRLGTVADGTTVSDHEPDEQEREMSIDASVACFEHDGREINLIDTPGEPSFVADAIAALRVADAAVVVVNGVMGVEVHTERLWRRADAEGLARLVFVNMLDRERADFFRALDSLKAAFGPHVVATEIPIGAEHEVRGVIDLIDLKAFVYEGAGRGARRGGRRSPRSCAAQAEEYREKLMDEVAENSDELMERYLDGEEIDHDEIVARAQAGRHRGADLPGHLRRRDRATSAPAACSRRWSRTCPRRRCAAPWRRADAGGEAIEIEPDEDGAARRLRLQDPRRPLHRPRQPLPRLPRHARAPTRRRSTSTRGQKERIGQLGQPLGKELRPSAELGAGDIGAVAKLKETRAGDVLCAGPGGDRLRAARPARTR